MRSSTRSIIPILVHVLLWILFGFSLLFYHPLTWGFSLPVQFWMKQLFVLAILAGSYYLNANFLVPRFLLKRQTYLYVTLLIAAIIVAVSLNQLADSLLNIRELMSRESKLTQPRPARHGIDMFTLTIICLVQGISTSITSIKKWQLDSETYQLQEKERVSSELSFLKAQINPHFFFNTLNNIYALTHIDIDASRKALLKLSRMMRYVLYDTSQNMTSLTKEISFIQDYIELMRLRFTDKVTLHIDIPVPAKDMPIAPMLFLPFIENAFKHGVSVTQPAEISISLKEDNGTIVMKTSNLIFIDQAKVLDENSGIGLANTERRLKLVYPGKHKITINNAVNSNKFEVELILNLS
ncbi:putative two-component system sensor protein [Arcticibacter svalbardensis MN12-7]|uniref:Putative two-component system sensor protein n=1 Tax=Arcticibacter svalbardensis MN12-7 TaxID=1150600 RepID=R9GV90_9SPHI|nr:histidine kinase [Arcticibacter svalbardensis]EOR95631.1 putative two-component system sensor protein [Arcticibacter svalbardensis MN12-7]